MLFCVVIIENGPDYLNFNLTVKLKLKKCLLMPITCLGVLDI